VKRKQLSVEQIVVVLKQAEVEASDSGAECPTYSSIVVGSEAGARFPERFETLFALPLRSPPGARPSPICTDQKPCRASMPPPRGILDSLMAGGDKKEKFVNDWLAVPAGDSLAARLLVAYTDGANQAAHTRNLRRNSCP
jgi:hypothetical protein